MDGDNSVQGQYDAIAGSADGSIPQVTYQPGLSAPGAGLDFSSMSSGASSVFSSVPWYVWAGLAAVIVLKVAR